MASHKLPQGFEYVPTGKKPAVTFDIRNSRFYLSTSLRGEYDIQHGSKVGLAYNKADRQLLIDLFGRGFTVDKRGYVTSKYFIERSYGDASYGADSIKYVVNSEISDGPFIVFDEA